MTAALAIALLLVPAQLRVKPSRTDPDINTYDAPHEVFFDTDAKPRHELLVFLPGTNGKPSSSTLICSTAAEQGYQVISLMYPDDTPATRVKGDRDADAFLDFRLTVIEGKPLSKYVHVDRANSIENRLIKVLKFLVKLRPREGWDHYITEDGQPEWRRIAVAGLSQGAGHALLIGYRHEVARVVLFGGPKDYSSALSRPAAWYKAEPKTPRDRVFTFNNKQDRQGCTFAQQLLNLRAVGLYRFGEPIDVDKVESPYKKSHMLETNYPGTPVPSDQAHTSVVGDNSTPTRGDGKPLFKPVWEYMLTATE